MKAPEYYLPIMPYIIMKGANDFLDFVKKVFNAKEQMLVPREDGTIMHGEISIGKAVIMLAEATEIYKPLPCGMFIQIEKVDEVYKRALENGASSLQAPEDRNYGRSAGFQDQFGNQWWLTKAE